MKPTPVEVGFHSSPRGDHDLREDRKESSALYSGSEVTTKALKINFQCQGQDWEV